MRAFKRFPTYYLADQAAQLAISISASSIPESTIKPASASMQQTDLACGRNSAFMEVYQLIRKGTKMEVIHLNQRSLATRWCVSEATLERWRTEGLGPKYLKLCGRVLYRLADIESYESACLMTSTSKSAGAENVAA